MPKRQALLVRDSILIFCILAGRMSEGKIIGGRKGENRKGTFGGFFCVFWKRRCCEFSRKCIFLARWCIDKVTTKRWMMVSCEKKYLAGVFQKRGIIWQEFPLPCVPFLSIFCNLNAGRFLRYVSYACFENFWNSLPGTWRLKKRKSWKSGCHISNFFRIRERVYYCKMVYCQQILAEILFVISST